MNPHHEILEQEFERLVFYVGAILLSVIVAGGLFLAFVFWEVLT